jgi:Transcriptional regulator
VVNEPCGRRSQPLVALDALLAERSVTRAADRVGLSQPGMSNTLARLRKLFGDPLLVARA